MAKLFKGNLSEGNQYSVIYSNMRGVDFSGDGSCISRSRFSHLENMYRDYEGDGDGITESIPGFRKIMGLEKKINGIYTLPTDDDLLLIIHAGDKLYRAYMSKIDTVFLPREIATVADRRSCGFIFAGRLFIMDGEAMWAVLKSGECTRVGENDGFCKIPVTYINGKEYEQRNLITRSFIEKYNVGAAEECAHETRGLKYSITDEENRLCAVAYLDKSYTGDVYIPSYTTIGDTRYRVTEIQDKAFYGCAGISALYMSEGVNRLGKFAFGNCLGLTKVILADSVTFIDNACFDNCISLSALHLGAGLSGLGNSVFSTCDKLDSFTYAKSQNDFNQVENVSVLGSAQGSFNVLHPELLVTIPVFSPAKSINKLLLNGNEQSFSTETIDGCVRSVSIHFSDRALAVGGEFILEGTLSGESSDYKNEGGFLASAFAREDAEVSSVIFGCTVCESYDGRIFLSGNPLYPNAVFHSSRLDNASAGNLHFGDYNYFCDGIGSCNVIAMLATGSSLAIFKDGDDGGGSIFYHTPRETGENLVPIIYPVSYVHGGTCALGAVCSFLDDPVFISKHGVTALDKQTINLERSVAIRSHNVNPKLLSENLKEARLAVWRGYLVLAVGGHIYLADSRATFTHETGNMEYEWYYLSDIGTYADQKPVWRYSSQPKGGWFPNEKLADSRVPIDANVWNSMGSEGNVYYSFVDGKPYTVYKTNEMQGGVFSPLCEIFVLDDLLFFGTESGDICLFNNDKRGVPPDSLANDPDFDPEEYKRLYGRQIHPSYYSFNYRAPLYAMRTALDDGGYPHMLKSSVKHSLTVKCKSFASGKLVCEVGTNKSGYREVNDFPSSSLSFADFDFASPSLLVGDSITLSIGEKEKGWVEKQISLYSREYQSPIGIYGIAYRFRIAGRLKSNYN